MTPLVALTPGPPNEVITVAFGGRVFQAGRRTAAHLEWTQQRLDRIHPGSKLLVIQPCYNTGVEASAGTHDKDRVLDVSITGLDWFEAQKFLRRHGWAAWVRQPPAFGWHIHMISLGGTGPVGVFVPGQIDDYYRHTFGLAGQHNTDMDKSWFPGDEGPPPWPVGTPEQWRRDIDATIFNFAQWERDWEENMPFRDWPEEDKAALVRAVCGCDRIKRIDETVTQLAQDERRRNMADIDRTRRVIEKVTGVAVTVEVLERALAEETDPPTDQP